MNTLVLLVAATCAPAADPLPVMETRTYPVPTYSNTGTQEWSGPPQESRPRFFARLRGLFSRRSQVTDGSSANLSGYSPSMTGNGTVVAPSSMASPGTATGNTSPSILQSQPTYTPTGSPALQRMPAGQPF